MLKISHVLNTVMLAESRVKTSRHIENVYVRHVENHIENHYLRQGLCNLDLFERKTFPSIP